MMSLPRISLFCCVLSFLLSIVSLPAFTAAQSLTFTQITSAAPWDARSEPALFLHPSPLSYYPPTSTTPTQSANNSFILLGGRSIDGNFNNDVWLWDGQSTWTLISGTSHGTAVSASPSSGPTTYVTNDGNALCADSTSNTLYVVSGFTYPAYYDRSTNGGVSWTNVQSASLPFLPRSYGTCVVDPRTGTMYMMGGLERINGGSPDPTLNDVWSYTPSTDTWTAVTTAAAWSSRDALSSAIVYNAVLGKTLMYVAGGYDNVQYGFGFGPADLDVGTSDVWVSSNGGVDWSQVSSAAFPPRGLGRLAISRSGVLVMSEGVVYPASPTYPHDVWASLDGGATWGQCSTNVTAPYPARRNHATAFDQSGRLVVAAGECYGPVACTTGYADTKFSDVWKSAISFDDVAAVARACGLTASPCGAGARCWPINGPCPCVVPPSSSSSSSSTAATRPPTASSSSTAASQPPVASSSSGSAVGGATSTPAGSNTGSSTASSGSTPVSPGGTGSSTSTASADPTPSPTTSSSTGALDAPPPSSGGSSSGGGGGISIGAIIGIVVGVILALLALCLVWAMCSRYRKNHSSPASGSSNGGFWSRGRSGRGRNSPADDTSSEGSSNGIMSANGRPLPGDQVVQIWGTGELELNGSKQASSGGTSSMLDHTSSVSRRSSDISGTGDSMGSNASAVYVHD